MEMKSRIPIRADRAMRARVTILGHPAHAIMTDFPLCCFTLAVIWNIVALATGGQPWYAITFWTLLAGVVLAVPTAVFGLLDYLKVLKQEHPGGRPATYHMLVMVTAVVLFLLSLVLRGSPEPLGTAARVWTFILAVAGLGILSVGGYLGGKLVYDYRIGVNPFDENDCV
jgi:uncharacterized membrane protein